MYLSVYTLEILELLNSGESSELYWNGSNVSSSPIRMENSVRRMTLSMDFDSCQMSVMENWTSRMLLRLPAAVLLSALGFLLAAWNSCCAAGHARHLIGWVNQRLEGVSQSGALISLNGLSCQVRFDLGRSVRC